MCDDCEMGGYILDDKIIISKGESHSHAHGNPEEVRDLAEKGAASFHAHTEGSAGALPQDVLAFYATLGEVIFGGDKESLSIITPISIKSISEMKQIADDLLEKSNGFYDEEYYHYDRFHYWDELVRKALPVQETFYSITEDNKLILEKETLKIIFEKKIYS